MSSPFMPERRNLVGRSGAPYYTRPPMRARLCPVWLALGLSSFLLLVAPACRRQEGPPPRPALPPPPIADAAVAPRDARPVVVVPPDGGPPTGVAPPPLQPNLARGKQITVLYSSNLRGEYDAHPLGGVARRATLVARTRPETDALVDVDAGDSLLPKIVLGPKDPPPDKGEVERRATMVASGLGKLGLDALTPGETDLTLGPARLVAIARKAHLPLVSANVVDGHGKPLFPASRLVKIRDVGVGIFGVLTLSDADKAEAAAHGYSVDDPVARGTAAAAQLRKDGAQVVVGLFHAAGGPAEARRLIAQIPGVDVVVLGHENLTTERPEIVQPAGAAATALVSAFERGSYVGRVDLHLVDGAAPGFADGRQSAPVAGSWLDNQIIRVDPRFVSDPALLAMVKVYVVENRRRAEKKLPVGLTARAGTDHVLAEGVDENWDYGSTSACELCHKETKEQFDTTAHALSIVTLEDKGRERDPECLRCHSTGFDQPGGTRNLQTAVTYFNGVGCESCHGPSVKHVRSQNKTGTMRKVPEAVCLRCHTPEQQLEPFDFATAMKQVLGPHHGG